eukprot:scaffold249330_cov73-Cyclotella_meneghiniana.AAC.3
MKINEGERACLPLSPFLCKERDVKRIIEDGFVLEREGKSGLLTVLELEVAIIAFVLFTSTYLGIYRKGTRYVGNKQ